MHGTFRSSNCADPQFSTDGNTDFVRDMTSGFSFKFIRFKATQLVGKGGFTAADRPDLEQELALALFQRLPYFDPKRGNWEAFTVMVIQSYSATLMRLRRRTKRLVRCIVSIDATQTTPSQKNAQISSLLEPRHASAITGRTLGSYTDQVELSIDANAVVASLPADLRYLCYWLQFETITELAARFRVSRTTLHERIKRVREAFVRRGFSARTPVHVVSIRRRYKQIKPAPTTET